MDVKVKSDKNKEFNEKLIRPFVSIYNVISLDKSIQLCC